MRISKQHAQKSSVGMAEALGQSEAFLEFQERLSRVARINRPVLLIGERGTGKELAASRLHFLSDRWQGPLVALNCAALTPSLIGAELFGYEKGAFTGAERRRTGRFETADGGTLFLDEIGTIPTEVQEKILRVVEYGTFERVGSSERIDVDVRIISATNADLREKVAKSLFKPDLLDRISFEVLFLPPLRERGEDILLLANHFAARMAFELGREDIPQFSPEAVTALETCPWKGNIRELKNVVERAVYRSDSSLITNIVFDPFDSPYAKQPFSKENFPKIETNMLSTDQLMRKPLKEAVKELEILLLNNALKESKYNQKKAARILGLTYHQFRGLHRKYKKA
ncbi:phage shock protein operon transcriptional activator [Desulfonema magnum]|uniref:Sigma54-specific transcriptional activator of phage shock protein, PspF-like n=1 Tax=Desulfonema magnum TaxID=45655 RepID=A0A975BV97_9BACT|nr:phage shock protein operon transcriptional activator [Desulfonema magnum]QTA92258.1 Putative sigma54-specific transcriptional activator of phage shock protein, PspF-like [Desulfonema magnum]